MHANIASEAENALRRALLFRRRGHMWRELPACTQWWEVCMEPGDLKRLRVFPRAQWRRIASGSFLLEDIVKRIRNKKFTGRTATSSRKCKPSVTVCVATRPALACC